MLKFNPGDVEKNKQTNKPENSQLFQSFFAFGFPSPVHFLGLTFQSPQIAALCILFKLLNSHQWER